MEYLLQQNVIKTKYKPLLRKLKEKRQPPITQ